MRPLHCVRFGAQVDVKGVLPGSPDADRLLGYLVKYLGDDLGADTQDDPTDSDTEDDSDGPDDDRDDEDAPARRSGRVRTLEEQESAAARADHRARLVHALRHEPCSPRCANWPRYGIQPAHARPGLRPGACKGKAHRPSHVGYGGRRVLVSRKWTGKDLADHRADRKTHVLTTLGDADELRTHLAGRPDPGHGVTWEKARPTDPDVLPASTRTYFAVARLMKQREAYRAAKAAALDRDEDIGRNHSTENRSATDPAASAA